MMVSTNEFEWRSVLAPAASTLAQAHVQTRAARGSGVVILDT